MKLTPQKTGQLKKILGSISQLNETYSRNNFLSLCELEMYSGRLKLDSSTDEFIISIFAKLSDVPSPSEPQEKSALIVFLEYAIELDEKLIDQDKEFIKTVIEKLVEQWKTKSQKTIDILSQLDEGRRNSPTLPQILPTVKVDRNIIIKFDLKPLKLEFVKGIHGYEGAFAFSVEGDGTLLKEYIIERIQYELKEITDRNNQQFDVHLYREKILNHRDIERRFIERYEDYNCLTDIFENQVGTDIMLIVWNWDIPRKIMKELAQLFWRELKQSVLPCVRSKSRHFVLIWANVGAKVGRSSLQGFTGLPTPDKFDLIELEAWFRSQLREQGVAANRIESDFNKLRTHCGGVLGTYGEMKQIIQELQGGSRLYG